MVLAFVRLTTKSLLIHPRLLTTSKVAFRPNRWLSHQTSHFNMEKIIAIGQMRASNDKAANRQQVQQIVENATKENACVCTFLLVRLKCVKSYSLDFYSPFLVCIFARML